MEYTRKYLYIKNDNVCFCVLETKNCKEFRIKVRKNICAKDKSHMAHVKYITHIKKNSKHIHKDENTHTHIHYMG